MEYAIALSPDLELDVDGFIAEWNATPESRQVGEAQPLRGSPASFLPPEITAALIFLAGAVGTAAVDAVKDIVKERVKAYLNKKFPPEQPKKPPTIEIELIPQGNGRRVILVVKKANP